MFDQGPHVVLRRDGVCLVLKTPEGEMPQVEYWGGDFGITSDESALNQLDAMTLKVTPPQEKPDAALRPSLLPQGAEAFAGRPGLEAYRGGPGEKKKKKKKSRYSCVGPPSPSLRSLPVAKPKPTR